MDKAIVALTRGYLNVVDYGSLIRRNQRIDQFFGNRYPVVLFHEGNITTFHKHYIQQKTPSLPLTFVDISKVWVRQFDGRPSGYESMCRFQMYWLWHYCAQYDYIMRIDEDCWIDSMESDPFDQIGDNVYLKTCYFAESHSETNATLPQVIESMTGAKREDFYNDKFVYTNVSVSSVKFWLDMDELLGGLALSDEQLRNRWGDLPVLGSLLNIYAKDKVGTTTGLTYYHHSHNLTIESA